MIRSEYTLVERIAHGPLCESWIAIRKATRQRVFLKRHTCGESDCSEKVHNQLRRSFEAQQDLSSLVINKANRIVELDRQILVEYPYLEPSRWRPLSTKSAFTEKATILPLLCLSVDYLHLMGYLHLDISSPNILLAIDKGRGGVRLTDLEFLRPLGSSSDNQVMGTPGNIAPEIIRNEVASIESDNYSLGRAMSALVDEYLQENPRQKNDHKLRAISALCVRLTREERFNRPKFLLEELISSGYLAPEEYHRYSTRLLRLLLIGKIRCLSNPDRSNSELVTRIILDKCGVLGVHGDLLELLTKAHGAANPQLGKVLLELFRSDRFLRSGSYWIAQFTDSLLSRSYSQLEDRGVSKTVERTSAVRISPDIQETQYARVYELQTSGRLERAFFIGLDIANCISSGNSLPVSGSDAEFILTMARLAYKLNRLEQADTFFRWLATGEVHGFELVGPDYVQWAYIRSKLGRRELAQEVIAKGKKYGLTKSDRALQLHLSRIECWLAYQIEDSDALMRSLGDIENEAREAQANDVLALTLYTKGVFEWRRGNLVDARRWLENSVRVCEDHKLLDSALPIYSTLSLIYCEGGEYVLATESCEKAAAICKVTHSYSQYYAICTNGMLAQSRLGNLESAERWLQEYLTVSDKSFDLVPYLQTKALFLTLSRNIRQAIEICHNALALSNSVNPSRVVGKLHDTLATNYFFQGELDKCRAHCDLAAKMFSELGDKAARSEIELIAAAAEVCYGKGESHANIISRITEYSTDSSLIISVQTAVIVFLMDVDLIVEELVAVGRRVRACNHHEDVPLFDLLVGLADSIQRKEDDLESLTFLKSRFLKLDGAGQLFVAMLVGIRIAQLYRDRRQAKHEIKYLEQALQLARELSNQPMISRIEGLMSQSFQSDVSTIEKEATILSISKILKEDFNFDQSAHHLLEFAVSQTGAERGVLLLAKSAGLLLSPTASVNCDDASVHEVTDFSRSIAASAAKGKAPTIIEDALSDDRTKGLKSIVMHNVRSIVACPMMEGLDCVGVLYLDHHTLPSLFSRADLQYISAIANFVTVALQKSKEFRNLLRSSQAMTEELHRSGLTASFLTQDKLVLDMLSKVPAIARSDRPVLLLGESGTGKEILCKMIHDLSSRAKQPLIKLNCAAISSTLLESELFGVAKGVATGVREREGKFEAADGGTLYMDEIGDMPLEMQAKVLRVLEDQRFERVGSNRSRSVNVRLIYATNRDLLSAVKDEKFKHDLYHRINKIQIVIPPLRERPTDIPMFINYFAQLFAEGGSPIRFTPSAEKALFSYTWPGNVRELRNIVERYSVVYPGQTITPDMLYGEILAAVPKSSDQSVLNEAREVESIRVALARYNWNRSKAAEYLTLAN